MNEGLQTTGEKDQKREAIFKLTDEMGDHLNRLRAQFAVCEFLTGDKLERDSNPEVFEAFGMWFMNLIADLDEVSELLGQVRKAC